MTHTSSGARAAAICVLGQLADAVAVGGSMVVVAGSAMTQFKFRH
jgi:hypothetical protein